MAKSPELGEKISEIPIFRQLVPAAKIYEDSSNFLFSSLTCSQICLIPIVDDALSPASVVQ